MADLSDFYELDALLSDEEQMIRDTVGKFVDNEFKPLVAEHFEAGTFPMELVPAIADMGLLGMHLDGYGCAGASAMAYGVACRELEAGDSGLRSFVSVQGSLCMFPIWKYGSEEQKEQWLPKMAAGETIGCFGLTEPDHGSDPSAMTTRATRDGDGWILNGAKRWITNAGIADLAIVWANSDEGFRGFLVPTDSDGFEARKIQNKLSLRASVTGEFYMDDVVVPESMRLPDAVSIGAPLSCLSEARYGIAFGAVGVARDCYNAALDYQQGRPQFGKPLSSFQISQIKFADMLTQMTNANLQAMTLGKLKEAHTVRPYHISMAKRHNCRVAIDTARTARAMMGANGVSTEYSPMRHANNMESVMTYEGTEEVHGLILGQEITGIPAFR
ncbi:MAG: acyl-CoA dehydrogenase family protein [Actinomycetota bacterium]|nr:acyl-CoA dehydrogenase family protein [Actinomycetota bacterium]MEE3140139.1 acyl-CoA dehydrogenase family protein [Actinomycetota bacterium]MEE3187727.1 acyl-CoA dehydrogenase family protein [Actinomycetota bacterium]